MKTSPVKLIAAFILMIVASCDEPETVVTNYVHPDGTVTRKIEMRNKKNSFKISDFQVPFDKTWLVKDTCEISPKGDTTWIKTAVKEFKTAMDISLSYKTDSGVNKEISRKALFNKSFKWFNTEYRFSEIIDKKLKFGFPLKDYLKADELLYYYSPDNIRQAKEHGADSLKFKAFNDSINAKVEIWTFKNIVSEWICEFSKLTEGIPGSDIARKSLKGRVDEFVNIVKENDVKFDSLWKEGVILKKILGENDAIKFKTEADSALETATRNYFIDFKDYSVRIVMPGKVIGTNGFIDSSEVLLWPVKSDYFLTEPYVMWAESKIPNRWAWIVSGLFLAFVITGVIMRVIKKG
ncbi:MAG: hypothetical protein WCS03_01680 [Bacteroidota bacterium]